MTEKFNADFYVTCATVIPVLFLAAAVQGQALVFLLQRARRRTARQRQWMTLRFFRFVVAAIVIARIAGEPVAL
jgi:anti-sigma-K factor RskA